MMKVYEVKVAKENCDGRFVGYDRVALTLNKEKAEELRVAEIAKIKAMNYWWMDTAKNWETGEPEVVVAELGEVVE